MDVPNDNTFKVLEERKNYLIIKNQKNNNKSGYMMEEISALDRIINFTKLILNNYQNEKTGKKYELENKNSRESDDEKGYEVIFFYEKTIMENYKLNISFIKCKGNNYIQFEPKKYIKSKYKWESKGKCRITSTILEDVLKKANEIEIK
jgi:hypothetical protein